LRFLNVKAYNKRGYTFNRRITHFLWVYTFFIWIGGYFIGGGMYLFHCFDSDYCHLIYYAYYNAMTCIVRLRMTFVRLFSALKIFEVGFVFVSNNKRWQYMMATRTQIRSFVRYFSKNDYQINKKLMRDLKKLK